MRLLFVSDLHLDPARTETNELFLQFLKGPAAVCGGLYILGDFLEYWLGDDDDTAELAPVLAALRRLAESGCPVFLMHGNRDFLIGPDFASRHALQLIEDPWRINIDGQPVLLAHGDTLCTDDLPYQAFRRMVRSDGWQHDFLGKPLADRRAMVRQLRTTSQAETRNKPATIMDVNQAAVRQLMAEHDIDCLIHGHTHRPDIHRMEAGRQRIVLGDWYENGSYLAAEGRRLTLHRLRADGADSILAETRI